MGKHDMMHDRSATFFLQGTVDVAQAPVALSASVGFYVTGLALMGGLCVAEVPRGAGRMLKKSPSKAVRGKT